MIRIQLKNGQIQVQSNHERINIDKVKRLFRTGSNLCDQEKISSVLITTNDSVRVDRYTKEYDQSATSGIYCVQFMMFKNNPPGQDWDGVWTMTSK